MKTSQVQSIVDQHHQNVDARTATKVRFQEPRIDEEDTNKQTDQAEPTNEVTITYPNKTIFHKLTQPANKEINENCEKMEKDDPSEKELTDDGKENDTVVEDVQTTRCITP